MGITQETPGNGQDRGEPRSLSGVNYTVKSVPVIVTVIAIAVLVVVLIGLVGAVNRETNNASPIDYLSYINDLHAKYNALSSNLSMFYEFSDSILSWDTSINTTEEASFIVFKGDDGIIYAKDGKTGEIIASGNDLGAVLQSVVDLIPDYGSAVIFIKPGQYEMYTGVRAAKAGLAIIGGWVWDTLESREQIDTTKRYYPTVEILLRRDNVKYFDFGFDDNRAMRVVMIGIAAYASSSGQAGTQHQNSTFIYLRNRVRQSLFRQLFIRYVGYGIKAERLVWEYGGLRDVYFEHVTVETPYYRAIDIVGDYNIRLTDVYAGWNKADDYIVNLDYGSFWVTRFWGLGGTMSTGGGIRISRAGFAVIRDSWIQSCRSKPCLTITASQIVTVDSVVLNSDKQNATQLLYLTSTTNLELRNVLGYYKNTAIYKENLGTFITKNVRLIDANTNIEYRSEKGGTATIPAGQTRITVTHGLLGAPSKVLITPLGKPDGKLWVENITPTSFDIVTDTAPSSDLLVSWYAELQ